MLPAPAAPESTAPAPQVSILLAAYNAAAFIRTAIASVQTQTLSNWELIVVNDASQDATAAVVAELAQTDPRIRLITLPANGGPSRARNVALAAARGRTVTLLDADDVYLPQRLQQLLQHLDAHSLHMVADNKLLYDAGAGRVVQSGLPTTGAPLHWTLESMFARNVPGSAFPLGLLKPLVRRDFWQQTGLQYREDFRLSEDLVLYSELLLRGARAEVLPTPGYVYTTPVGLVSAQASAATRTTITLQELLRSGSYLLDTYADQLTGPERRAIVRRQYQLQQREHARALRNAIKRFHLIQALRLSLHTPGSWLPLLRGVRNKLMRRFNLDGLNADHIAVPCLPAPAAKMTVQ